MKTNKTVKTNRAQSKTDKYIGQLVVYKDIDNFCKKKGIVIGIVKNVKFLDDRTFYQVFDIETLETIGVVSSDITLIGTDTKYFWDKAIQFGILMGGYGND
jgi:hypothetical protein